MLNVFAAVLQPSHSLNVRRLPCVEEVHARHNVVDSHHDCVFCPSGICTMCGRKVMDTSKYKMSLK